MRLKQLKRWSLAHVIRGAALALCAVLVTGCAVLTPAPVSERTPPPKPGAKPAAPATSAQPDAAPKPDAGVIVTPLPSTSPGAPTGPTHTVKPGDTLFSIAKANNVDHRALAAWNNVDPASIKVGQQLRLTPPDGGMARAKPLPGSTDGRPPEGSAPSADPNMKTQPLGQRVPYQVATPCVGTPCGVRSGPPLPVSSVSASSSAVSCSCPIGR